jgi:hypothetical protein
LLIAAVVALVVVYHKQILEAITYTWNAVIDYVSDKMLAIYNAFVTWGTNLSAWWSGLWTGIYNALESVFSKIETVINSILSAVSKVTGAVSSVVGAVGGAVGGTIGGAIKAFASGGIVNSPTLALIGEAGPEAVIPLSAFNGGSSLGTGGGSGRREYTSFHPGGLLFGSERCAANRKCARDEYRPPTQIEKLRIVYAPLHVEHPGSRRSYGHNFDH